jgi:hypothetical protein
MGKPTPQSRWMMSVAVPEKKKTVPVPDELKSTLEITETESQITVFINRGIQSFGCSERIWPCIELRSKTTDERAKLLHLEGLLPFPNWTHVAAGQHLSYCMVFERLGKNATRFDIVEEIPSPGGFFLPDVVRNQTDVYHFQLP